ncbi:MAG: ATP-binding protein [Polyangiales bacterium]
MRRHHQRSSTTLPAPLVVLTGGPGAGKTAVLEVVRRAHCEHVVILPETASILFSGGFPRGELACEQRASQRAIFYAQRELERQAIEAGRASLILCDRGMLDGLAYWPRDGEPGLLGEVGVSRSALLAHYAAVIHLRTPTIESGYDHTNPIRVENAVEAHEIDARIAAAWAGHRDLHEIASTQDFLDKVRRTLAILSAYVPDECRHSTPLTVIG